MDPLRLTILGIGLVVLAAIYLHGRRREQRRQAEARRALWDGDEAPAEEGGDRLSPAETRAAAPPDGAPEPEGAEDEWEWELRPAAHDMPFADDQALEALDRLITHGEARTEAAAKARGRRAPPPEKRTEEGPEGPWWETPPSDEAPEGGLPPEPEFDPLEEAEARTGDPLMGLADEPEYPEEPVTGAGSGSEPEPRTEPIGAPEEEPLEALEPLQLPPASKLEIAAYRTGNLPEAEKIITVHVEAPEGQLFQGKALAKALRAAGMGPGEHRIWHRRGDSEVGRFNVYSVANMVEPGYLDTEHLNGLETPGVTFFMQLPLPVDGEEALDAMLATARLLAVSLEGELLDANHSTLTRQAAAHMQEELREHRRRVHVAAYRTKK